jgi:hypothetical protein
VHSSKRARLTLSGSQPVPILSDTAHCRGSGRTARFRGFLHMTASGRIYSPFGHAKGISRQLSTGAHHGGRPTSGSPTIHRVANGRLRRYSGSIRAFRLELGPRRTREGRGTDTRHPQQTHGANRFACNRRPAGPCAEATGRDCGVQRVQCMPKIEGVTAPEPARHCRWRPNPDTRRAGRRARVLQKSRQSIPSASSESVLRDQRKIGLLRSCR